MKVESITGCRLDESQVLLLFESRGEGESLSLYAVCAWGKKPMAPQPNGPCEITYSIADTFTTSGYQLDKHDVKLLPNGHALIFGSEARIVNMSLLVSGGRTAAQVTGVDIQELDANKQLVFEWHSFDPIPITDTFADEHSTDPGISELHHQEQ